MLVNIINTVLDYLWYEVYEYVNGTETTYEAICYDAEFGNYDKVAVEWKECHVEGAIRRDMARLGIA